MNEWERLVEEIKSLKAQAIETGVPIVSIHQAPDWQKVGFTTLTGHPCTAYVIIDGDRAEGERKHSEEPVSLRWDGEFWREIEGSPLGGVESLSD